jgi:hypothetical protein
MKAISILTAAIIVLLSLPIPAQSQTPIISAPQGYPLGSLIPIAVNAATGYSQPAVVYANNLNTYFVAYRSSLNEIIVNRLSPAGRVTGSFTVAAARDYYDRRAPRLAYSTIHQELLVVWEDTDTSYNVNILGRIFNQAGTPISSLITICTGAVGAQCFHPALAYSPVQDRYMVVWQRTSGPQASGDIGGEFITSAGGLEKFISVRSAGGNQSFAQPDIAFNHRRNEYLVVFQMTDCIPNPCNTDILGHRVNYLGDVLDDSFGIKIGYLGPQESHPAVAAYPDASESKCWMVAWTLQFTSDPLDRDIYHNLLNCDGVSQGGFGWALVSTDLDDYNPAIAFNESTQKYLVVWALTTNVPLDTSSTIGMEMTTAGDAAAAPWLIGGWFGSEAVVAAGPNGDFLVVYTESVAFGQQQVLGRLWGNRVYVPLVKK